MIQDDAALPGAPPGVQLSFQSTSDVRSPSVVLATKPAAAGPPAPSARAGPVDVGAPPTALCKAFPMPAKRFTQDGIPQLPRQHAKFSAKKMCAWTANWNALIRKVQVKLSLSCG